MSRAEKIEKLITLRQERYGSDFVHTWFVANVSDEVEEIFDNEADYSHYIKNMKATTSQTEELNSEELNWLSARANSLHGQEFLDLQKEIEKDPQNEKAIITLRSLMISRNKPKIGRGILNSFTESVAKIIESLSFQAWDKSSSIEFSWTQDSKKRSLLTNWMNDGIETNHTLIFSKKMRIFF